MRWDGWMWGGHPWLMVLAVLGTVLFWLLVVLAVVRMLRPHGRAVGPDPETPGDLDALLARGEIDIEEYRSRRRRLVDGH